TQTLASSLSLPPIPLLTLLFIIFFLLFLSSYSNYKNHMNHTYLSFKVILLFLPVILIFLAQLLSKFDTFPFFLPSKAAYGRATRLRRLVDLPWGMVAVVVFLLLMISFQSSLQSLWSPLVRRSN
ncbi:hypothetical protein LINGRAHAP2_LOCUS10014, partial [Linum grandiflorum]